MKQIRFTLPEGNFRDQLLFWLEQFPQYAMLDSCGFEDAHGTYQWLCGIRRDHVHLHTFDALKTAGGWKLGVFAYHWKDETEPSLNSRLPEQYAFPPLYFFEPEVMLWQKRGSDEIVLEADDPGTVLDEILAVQVRPTEVKLLLKTENGFQQEEYLKTVEQLRNHIRDGDCYEINLCVEFHAKAEIPSAGGLFSKMTRLNPAPHSTLMRLGPVNIWCASPERFLCHRKGNLTAQPMKGTMPRGKTAEEDLVNRNQLRESIKDQAENVMIVDLTRNDLYKSCRINTVEVPNLFEVQTFPLVHQMVSTVTGVLADGVHPLEAVQKCFPPGSMTGAPKVAACKLIEAYEKVSRGVYSGAAGYISPDGDFDFNVIIRTLIGYGDGNLTYHAGGAIVWDSSAEGEWEEVLLKMDGMRRLF